MLFLKSLSFGMFQETKKSENSNNKKVETSRISFNFKTFEHYFQVDFRNLIQRLKKNRKLL